MYGRGTSLFTKYERTEIAKTRQETTHILSNMIERDLSPKGLKIITYTRRG